MNASSEKIAQLSYSDFEMSNIFQFTFDILDWIHFAKLDEDDSTKSTVKHFFHDSFNRRRLLNNFLA